MRRDASAATASTMLLCSAAIVATAAPSAASGVAAQCGGFDGWGTAEAESEQMRADLVQTRAQVLGSRGAGPGARQPVGGDSSTARASAPGLLRSVAGAGLSVGQRAGLLVPMAWFHVPKTGSSIVNMFYHTPAICPNFRADNYVVEDDLGDAFVGYWSESWGDLDDVCAGGFSNDTVRNGHLGIGGVSGSLYQSDRGHLVTMVRQPEQRLISAYNYYDGAKYVGSLRKYAEMFAGCAVRQLTRDYAHACGSSLEMKARDGEEQLARPALSSGDVSVAIDMLHDGFAFVGITDQWALSVCLFRVMFGGQCLASDLLDVRPGGNSSSSYYDTSELFDWVDDWDGPLYAEAALMFESSLTVYGVDASSCRSMCQDQYD